MPTSVASRPLPDYDGRMDLTPYVESVRRHVAELKRRNAEAQARARGDLPKLVAELRRDDRIRKAYLYGSLAKDTFHPDSDIDIAVDGLDPRELDGLRKRLEPLTEFRVDLRDLDGTPEFRKVIEFYGVVLHDTI